MPICNVNLLLFYPGVISLSVTLTLSLVMWHDLASELSEACALGHVHLQASSYLTKYTLSCWWGPVGKKCWGNKRAPGEGPKSLPDSRRWRAGVRGMQTFLLNTAVRNPWRYCTEQSHPPPRLIQPVKIMCYYYFKTLILGPSVTQQ